jgi:hypothetical protein
VQCAGATSFDVTTAATVGLRCQEESVAPPAAAAAPSSSPGTRLAFALALLAAGVALSRRRLRR